MTYSGPFRSCLSRCVVARSSAKQGERIELYLMAPIGHLLDDPYGYGTIVCMKKRLNIDYALLRAARQASHALTDTETVRLGLLALVREAAYQRLSALRGSEPMAADVPRR
jgi:hypothetical protein